MNIKRKEQYEKEQSGLLGSLVKSFKGLFTKKEMTTNQRFLQQFFDPKFNVVMDANFSKQLKFFDLHSEKKILMVYVKNHNGDLKASEEKIIFNNSVMQTILKETAFAGILSNEKHNFIQNTAITNSFIFFAYYDKKFTIKKTNSYTITFTNRQEQMEDILAQFRVLQEQIAEIDDFQLKAEQKMQ